MCLCEYKNTVFDHRTNFTAVQSYAIKNIV